MEPLSCPRCTEGLAWEACGDDVDPRYPLPPQPVPEWAGRGRPPTVSSMGYIERSGHTRVQVTGPLPGSRNGRRGDRKAPDAAG